MDISYLLTIAVVFVIWLVINAVRSSKHEKQAASTRKPTSAEEKARIISLEADFAARLEQKGLSWLMLEDYSFRQTITPPNSTPLRETERQLQQALIEILEHLHLLPIVRLKVTDDPGKLHADNMGEYSHGFFQKEIRLLIKPEYSAADVLDCLCHEATHFFMYSHNMQAEDRNLNEGLTEVGACMIGFSEAVLSSSMRRNYPYLRKEEFEQVRHLLLRRRASMRPQTDPETARRQLRRNLQGVGPMLEQARAMIAANTKPNPRRMSPEAAKAMQRAMLALEAGEYEETLRRAEAALQKDAEAVRAADSEVLAICGTLFQVMLTFRPD